MGEGDGGSAEEFCVDPDDAGLHKPLLFRLDLECQ